MTIKIVELGPHLPMSTRRVVSWIGQSCQYRDTPIGCIEGLADGAVVIRDFDRGTHYELTPAEARKIAEALDRASFGVEEWQRRARGHYVVRVRRDESGVFVTYRDATLPMRLSKLRRPRRCIVCDERVLALWIPRREPVKHTADGRAIWRERPAHDAEVCGPRIDRLANAPSEIAEVRPLTEETVPT